MNKSYKVVFSKARGALMVANELTSSVQAKGTKTIIAAAVTALMAGGAMAADVNWKTDTAVTVGADEVVTVDVTAADEAVTGGNTTVKNVQVNQGGTLNVTEGGRIINQNIKGSAFVVNGGTVNVSGNLADTIENGTEYFTYASSVDSTDVCIQAGMVNLGNPNATVGQDVGEMSLGNRITGYDSFLMTGGTVNMNAGAILQTGSEGVMTLAGGTINMQGRADLDGASTGVKNGAALIRAPKLVLSGADIALKNFETDLEEVHSAFGKIASADTLMTGGSISVTASQLQISNAFNKGDDSNLPDVWGDVKTGTEGVFTMTGGTITAANGGTLFSNVKEFNALGGKIVTGDKAEGDMGSNWFEARNLTLGGNNVTTVGQDAGVGAAGMLTVADNAKIIVEAGGTLFSTAKYQGTTDAEGIAIKGGNIVLNGTKEKAAKINTWVSQGGVAPITMTDGQIRVTKNGEIETTELFSLEGGNVVIDADAKLTVKSKNWVIAGGSVTNNGLLAYTGDLTIDEGGVLTTKLTAADAQLFGKLFLDEGGKLVMVEPNSEFGLLLAGATYNMNGGRLMLGGSDYTGDIKVGGKGDKYAQLSTTVNINSGEYTVGNIVVANGALNITGGRLEMTGDLTIGEQGELTQAPSLTVNGGTFALATADIVKDATQETWAKADEFADVTLTSGYIDVTDKTGAYDLDDLKKYQDVVGNNVQVTFSKGDLDTTDLTTADVDNKVVAGETVAAAAGGASFSGANTVLGGIDYGTAEEGTISVTKSGDADAKLTLTGDKATGNLFKTDMKTVTVSGEGTFQLGMDGSDKGTVNAETLKVTSVAVNGDFKAKTVDLSGAGSVTDDGVLALTSLTGTGTMNVNGVLSATNIEADVTVGNGGMLVLNTTGEKDDGVTGTITIGQPAGGLSLTSDVADEIAFGGTNDKARDIVAASFITDTDMEGVNGVYYADKFVKIADEDGAQINVATASGTKGTLTVGAAGALVVDANALGGKALLEGNLTTETGAKAFLLNLNKTGNFELATGDIAMNGVEFKDDNFFVEATVGAIEGATGEGADKVYLQAKFDKDAVGDQNDADMVILANAMEAGMNASAKNAEVFKAIGNNEALLNAGKTQLNDNGVWAAEEYIATPVVSGTYNVAYDAAAEVTRSVAKRNVQGEGMGAWADVFYASNEAKKAYGDQGYSADIYGGVFGFDTTFSCGAKLGAALTIGQADADSERSFSKFSTDADFYGLSVYTGKAVGDTSLYIGADVSYLWFENDISGTVAGASADESIDSNVFTIGLRADWTAYEGAFNVVPHVGVRYTAIDVDNYRGYESDSMNVVELPIGVKVAGAFEPAAGWKLVPSVDFTVVPQVGDKDVQTDIGTVDVIDSLYNTTVGVEAAYGNYAFGLDAGYGFGNDDRQNATVKANFSYRF